MKRYVPTFESYVQSLLLESVDSLLIDDAGNPKLEFTTGKKGYQNAFPFFVSTDPSGKKNVLISDTAENHGDFEVKLRSEGTTGSQTSDDAGRIFIFDDLSTGDEYGFAVLTFYVENEETKSVDKEITTKYGTYLFIKEGELKSETVDAVAKDFKATHKKYSVYLEDPKTKKLIPLLGSPEFGKNEYRIAERAFAPLKAQQNKEKRDIELGQSNVYDKPKSPYYAKQPGGGLRDA